MDLHIPSSADELSFQRDSSNDAVSIARILASEIRIVEGRDIRLGEDNADTNTIAINAFLLKYKVSDFGLIPKLNILFPPGEFYFSGPILTWPGLWLTGNGTTLITASGFTGNCITRLEGLDGGGTYFYRGGVVGMSYRSAIVDVAAILANTGVLVNSRFENIVLDTCDGVIFGPGTYCQELDIKCIFSQGPINTILKMAGNWNRIENIDKEGISGTNTEPYIQLGHEPPYPIYSNIGNVMKRVLIEGAGHPDKVADILLIRAHGFRIENQWHEAPVFSPIVPLCVKIKDTIGGRFSGVMSYDVTRQVGLNIENSTGIYFDEWYGPAFGQLNSNAVVIDDNSSFTIGTLFTRLDSNTNMWEGSDRVRIKETVCTQIRDTVMPGFSIYNTPFITSSNLFTNPSFEKVLDGWQVQFTGSPVITNPPSTVSTGNMLSIDWGTEQAYQQIYKVFNITPEHVGKPFSFAGWVEVVEGEQWINPLFSGCGLTNEALTGRCYQSGSWQLCSRTVVPLSAGPLFVGINLYALTKINIDSFAFRPGIYAIPDIDPPYVPMIVTGRGDLNSLGELPTTGFAASVLASEGDRGGYYAQTQAGGGASGFGLFAYNDGNTYFDIYGNHEIKFRPNNTEALKVNGFNAQFGVDVFAPNLTLNFTNKITTGEVIPTTGPHTEGDICLNASPHLGDPTFWICVGTGEPGIWLDGPIIGGPLVYGSYGDGASYVVTGTSAEVNRSGTDSAITLDMSGRYMIHAGLSVYYMNATYPALAGFTLGLKRTNNTPTVVADITNIIEVGTTQNKQFQLSIKPFPYTTSNANDRLALFAGLSAIPDAGTIEATLDYIIATRLGPA